jgi:hypothetical protein
MKPLAGAAPIRSTPRLFWCVIRRISADVNDAPVGYFLGWRFWLCRKLKHRCLLTLDEFGQQDGLPIRKLECVMMHPRHVFVDLPKDRRPGF